MSQVPDSDSSLGELEQELNRVKGELEEYQGLIEELPSIYEGKFQHQLRDVAQDIRRLLDERQGLQQQIDRALKGAPPGLDNQLPSDNAFQEADPVPPDQDTRSSKTPVPLLLLSALTVLAVAGVVAAFGLWNRARPPQIAAPEQPAAEALAPAPEPDADPPEPAVTEAPLAPDSLRLRAKGECWVEVQTLDGRRVFMATLQEGEQRRLALGEGLRLVAGRPDLLELAIGTGEFSTLGPIQKIEWTTLRPQAKEGPAS